MPITISEAKPSDIAGVERISEPATFGIPLREEDNITNISQLWLLGVSCGQFRVLKRYPGPEPEDLVCKELLDSLFLVGIIFPQLKIKDKGVLS